MLPTLIAAAIALAAERRDAAFTKHVIDAEFPAISAVAADIDGDGKLDVVAAGGPSGGPSKWSNLAYWYKAPSWEKKLLPSLDPKAVLLHIDAADLAHNGQDRALAPDKIDQTDVVLTDGQLGQVWAYRYQRQTGTWTPRLIVDRAQYAHGIALGDLDGDGFIDVLAPHQAPGAPPGVLWAKNPGHGPGVNPGRVWDTFPLAEKSEITGWLHYAALGDVNGDGRPDALLASDGRPGWLGYWLRPLDPRTPWEFHRLPLPEASPASGAASRPAEPPLEQMTNLITADLNGDQKPDLVASSGHGRGLWWFPSPRFEPVFIAGSEDLAAAHSLAVGDFNGDGATDLASCGYESKRVMLFLNRGDATFRAATIDTGQCAYDLRAVDLDADGDPDLLLSGQNSGNLVWYENRSAKP